MAPFLLSALELLKGQLAARSPRYPWLNVGGLHYQFDGCWLLF